MYVEYSFIFKIPKILLLLRLLSRSLLITDVAELAIIACDFGYC